MLTSVFGSEISGETDGRHTFPIMHCVSCKARTETFPVAVPPESYTFIIIIIIIIIILCYFAA